MDLEVSGATAREVRPAATDTGITAGRFHVPLTAW